MMKRAGKLIVILTLGFKIDAVFWSCPMCRQQGNMKETQQDCDPNRKICVRTIKRFNDLVDELDCGTEFHVYSVYVLDVQTTRIT